LLPAGRDATGIYDSAQDTAENPGRLSHLFFLFSFFLVGEWSTTSTGQYSAPRS